MKDRMLARFDVDTSSVRLMRNGSDGAGDTATISQV
jgi:hypothetical protein